MFVSKQQLKAALQILDHARQDEQREHHCPVARVGSDASTERTVEAPPRRNGSYRKPFTVPHGTHDADFLQVNVETGEVRCGACAGELDASVPVDK